MKKKLLYWAACKESLYAPVQYLHQMRWQAVAFFEAFLAMSAKLIGLSLTILAAVLFPLTAVLLVAANRKKMKKQQRNADENLRWRAAREEKP